MVHSLNKQQVERYSRQLLVPGFGAQGQDKLVKGSVLIVGAGGLGCPAGLYLAGAGIGRVGFVDFDTVEPTNLHRQILHTEGRVGVMKAESACDALRNLNSTSEYTAHCEKLDRDNAVRLVEAYDVVIDASDNAVTRYLINDACIIAGKPLISGAALRWEGQLITYNHNGGPCYRCLYPCPPPPAAITNCDAGGVLGPVTGTIGSLQALEAIRIISNLPAMYNRHLLLFDGQTGAFKTVKVRGRQPDCHCSRPGQFQLCDSYEEFCGSSATDKTPASKLLDKSDRISCKEFIDSHKSSSLLIDVRPEIQYEICSIPCSINIPFSQLEQKKEHILESIENDPNRQIVTVCRRGNQSQQAVIKLRSMGFTNVRDIIGGIRSWSLEIDPDCPIY